MLSFVAALKTAVNVPLYANQCDDAGTCVVYDLNPLSYDGIKSKWRAKIQIRCNSMAEGLAIQSDISKRLCTVGDNQLTETVLTCRQNGGGWLEDGDKHVRIVYYEFLLNGGY